MQFISRIVINFIISDLIFILFIKQYSFYEKPELLNSNNENFNTMIRKIYVSRRNDERIIYSIFPTRAKYCSQIAY